MLGDTSSGNPLLQDEEIDAITSFEGGRDLAAAYCAETIGATFAGKVDKTVGKLKISQSQASGHYFGLAERLRFKANSRAAPSAGGISIDDTRDEEQRPDRVKPAFSIGFTDYTSDTINGSTTQ